MPTTGESSSGQARGYMVLSCIAYVEKTYDADTKRRLYAGLPEDVRAQLDRYNKVEWYPRHHCSAFFKAIALHEPNDEAAYRALYHCGRAIAEMATHTYMKLLMKIITTSLFARKVPDFWARDHRGGKLTADTSRLSENRLLVTLTDIEGYEYVAPTASGFMTYALDAMGKTGVECTLTGWSMQNPAPRDVAYDITWKK